MSIFSSFIRKVVKFHKTRFFRAGAKDPFLAKNPKSFLPPPPVLICTQMALACVLKRSGGKYVVATRLKMASV